MKLLKFDIDKAFRMLYDISTSKKGASSVWLAERFRVQQNTAWLFRQKVQKAKESSQNHPLDGEGHVDEFEIGTPKKDEQDRAHSKGKNFPMLHIQIRNFKNWIRGVHSYCDKKYLQQYINEYFFRFNRRNHRESILDKLIERCVDQQPITRKVILNLAI